MRRAWWMIALMAGMMLGCTNEVPFQFSDTVEETDSGPSTVDEGFTYGSGSTCVGLQENPNTVDFSPVCEELFKTGDIEQSNGACLILDDDPEAPCFCKICGVKGGGDTMKFLCLKVVCN